MLPSDAIFAWPSGGTRLRLAESVESFAENMKRAGNNSPVLLALDGTRAELPAAIASRLDALAAGGRSLFACDREDRERFISAAKRKFDVEVLRWALVRSRLGQGAGSNRNAIALATAGSPTVSTDDDLLCLPAVSPTSEFPQIDGSAQHAENTASASPWENRYFSSEEAITKFPRAVEIDVEGEYRRIFARSVEEGLDIAVACAGSYGDSGYGVARGTLCLEGGARAALISGGYENLRLSRFMTRLSPRECVGDGSYIMGMQLAFAGTSFLPPFIPTSREEDSLFGFAFRVLHPGSRMAYPTFGFLHRPCGFQAVDRAVPDGDFRRMRTASIRRRPTRAV